MHSAGGILVSSTSSIPAIQSVPTSGGITLDLIFCPRSLCLLAMHDGSVTDQVFGLECDDPASRALRLIRVTGGSIATANQ